VRVIFGNLLKTFRKNSELDSPWREARNISRFSGFELNVEGFFPAFERNRLCFPFPVFLKIISFNFLMPRNDSVSSALSFSH